MFRHYELQEGKVKRLRIALTKFRGLMLKKLISKVNEGWCGWEDIAYKGIIRQRLSKAVKLRKWVNVANLAMFLYFLDEKGKK